MLLRIKNQFVDFIADGLWTEGVGLFFRYWRHWLYGAAGFIAAGFIIRYLVSGYTGLYDVFLLLLQIAQFYFFSVCFLQQEPISGAIKRDTKNTLRAVIFIAIQAGILFIVHSLLTTLTPLNDFAVGFIQSYVAVSVFFLSPLAVNNFDNVLSMNLRLVARNFFRLWGNWVMVHLLFAPYFIFTYIFSERTGASSVNPLISVLMAGLMSGLACAACKILYGEYMAARYGDRRGSSRV